ncbi:ceramidase domain-containing protein [Pirellulaceae bacterium SH467]
MRSLPSLPCHTRFYYPAMQSLFPLGQFMLQMYRERGGDPAFWAEPFNAISNASFLIAAALGLDFATRKRSLNPTSLALILLAATIGCGSFLFHTVPTLATMWLDIIPITLFQILYLWLISRKLLSIPGWPAALIVVGVVGASYVLMPMKTPLNGSLFYIPSWAAMLVYSLIWARKSPVERGLLALSALFFTLAIAARSVDWDVPWAIGTHFLWHLLNGIVVYTALRSWVLATSQQESGLQG